MEICLSLLNLGDLVRACKLMLHVLLGVVLTDVKPLVRHGEVIVTSYFLALYVVYSNE